MNYQYTFWKLTKENGINLPFDPNFTSREFFKLNPNIFNENLPSMLDVRPETARDMAFRLYDGLKTMHTSILKYYGLCG